MSRQLKLEIRDSSQTGGARRAVQALAEQVGLDATLVGKIAIAATELSTNLLKHGKGGELLARPLANGAGDGMELLALDRGPGIADLGGSMRDGFSTAGSMGTGLGSLSRLATCFDIHSMPGKGTVVLAGFNAGPRANAPLKVGAVSLPKDGETECGDDWTVTGQGPRHMVLVADGLGHGPDAHKAALTAVQVARSKAARDPAAVLDDIHHASRSTRGAAVAVCAIEHESRLCRFAGVGNIACAVVHGGRQRQFASLNGIVGHSVRKITEFSAPWPAGALLVMHSDGLATQWDLAAYPGLVTRHPSIIAGVLYRDFSRGRDDVTVVVAREEVAA